MFGQGGPNFHRYLIAAKLQRMSVGAWQKRTRRCLLFVAAPILAALLVLDVSSEGLTAQEGPRLNSVSTETPSDLKLRFAWGGGIPQKWSGKITIKNGAFVSSRPLAITADSPSTVVRRKQELIIDHRIATSYGGADVAIAVDDNSSIQFSIKSKEGKLFERTWSLADILAGVNESIDQQQNRLSISRSPGDQIRVDVKRPHLVFRPGESWRFNTTLQRTPLANQTVRANFFWQKTGTRIPISDAAVELISDANGTSNSENIEILVPTEEGVHNLVVELEPQSSISAIGQFLRARKLTRRIQIVVVDDEPLESIDEQPWKTLRTWTPQQLWRSSRSSWPRFSGSAEPARQGAQSVVAVGDSGTEKALQLEPGSTLSIPIQRVDNSEEVKPVRATIRYRAIRGTKLGVNYLSATQQVLHGIDTGIALPASPTGIDPEAQWMTHTLHIWPEETAGKLFLSNDSKKFPVQIGEIRLDAGPPRLTATESVDADSDPLIPKRRRMAFLESPDISGLFQAQRVLDPQTGQSLDDWQTFYDSIDRLTQHLKSNAWDGAFVTIASDGSAICPSAGLAIGPRFDSGIFSSSGCDPVQKDVVELMMRMFDREGLKLVPILTLNSTLEPLESLREAELMSFDLVGEDGSRVDFNRSLLPTYNPLDRTLQGFCTQGIVRLANRYSNHRSFAGIALTCRPDCYTMLPGAGNGLDNITMQRFLGSQNIDASSFEPTSIVQAGDPNREAWLKWRSNEMQSWYTDIHQKVDAPLFLLPIDIYRRHEVASAMSPSLRRSGDFADVMTEMGLDIDPATGVEILAPEQVAPGFSLSKNRIEINTRQSLAATDFYSTRNSGALFAHRGIWRSIDRAEATAESGVSRKQLYLPAGAANRRRYIEAIRKFDCQLVVEGGSSLPVDGDNENDALLNTIRALPAKRFEDIGDSQSGPICMRQLSVNGEHWFYAVNDSPWPVKVTAWLGKKQLPQVLQASSNSKGISAPLTTIAGTEVLLQQRDGRTEMDIFLEPWTIYAGVAQTNSAYNPYAIGGFRVELPEKSDSQLRKRLHQLKSKLSRAKVTKPLPTLLNGSFESFVDPDKSGWEFGNHEEARFNLDSADYREGRVSLSMETQGKPVWIRSNEIPVPKTGRLSVSAWFKTTGEKSETVPRISLEGVADGVDFYRFAPVSQANAEENSLDHSWRKFVAHFDDLPADLAKLRIGFDLMSRGQVSIDHVEVFDRWLDENDSVAMTQLLASAGSQLENEETIDSARRVLESYWVQFLDLHMTRETKKATPPQEREARNTFEIPLPQMPSFELQKIAPGKEKRVPLFQRLQRRD